ncbi:multivesicular body subunit 12A [Hyperolius riggenbachi]|uniref:multivesicular body subunit 12A n=1 Tax=Hyperolius riggenbachi TaxID=752182 RepID=UPI0035A39435
MEENNKPLTSVVWASSQSLCPKGHSLIVASVEGASANFLKGFNQKSALYLSYSTTSEGMEQVITELLMLNEKSPLPVGCAFIGEYIDPKITVPKKKRLCIKLVPIHNAESAVADLKLTVKNKPLSAPYIRIGDMSGLTLWCKKVPVSAPKPTPKPRNILAGIGGLSIDNSSLMPQPTINASKPKSPLHDHPIYEANVYGVSAIDGIPFTIHPMFESRVGQPSVATSNFHDLRIKTLADIENEYNYGFVVERTACAR